MSSNLKRCLPILVFIAEIKDKKLKIAVLKYYAKYPKFFLALREICRNLIKGNVKLSAYKRKKLLKQKQLIYSIAYDKLDKAQKSKKVTQSGGFSWIYPLIASLINLI